MTIPQPQPEPERFEPARTVAWIERWAQAHPPEKRHDPRSMAVSVNVSPRERERISAWADAQGLSMSAACL